MEIASDLALGSIGFECTAVENIGVYSGGKLSRFKGQSPWHGGSMSNNAKAFGLIFLSMAVVWLATQIITPEAPVKSGDIASQTMNTATDQSQITPSGLPDTDQPHIQPLWTANSGDPEGTWGLDVSLNSLTPGSESKVILGSGSEYLMRVLSASQKQELLQINANIIDKDYQGFALITLHGDLVVGTFNTPEGVFELYGSTDAFRLRRAAEIDGSRRSGVDYRVGKPSESLSVPVKEMPTLGAK